MASIRNEKIQAISLSGSTLTLSGSPSIPNSINVGGFVAINLTKPAGYIYKITNTINGMMYIGQTIGKPIRRFKRHLSNFYGNKHPNKHMQNAYNKHGNVFEIQIIDIVVLESSLDHLECFWIKYYNSMDDKIGYNKMSVGNSNKKASEETKLKMSGPNHHFYGKKLSKEHVDKTRLACTGQKRDQKCKDLISLKNKGKTRTFEQKKSISNSLNYKKIQIKDSLGNIYNGCCEAIKKYNIPKTSLFNILRSGNSWNGIKFAKINEDFLSNKELLENQKKLFNSKSIICLNNNKIYCSIQAAADDLFNGNASNISNVCSGKRNHTRGFKFRYYGGVK